MYVNVQFCSTAYKGILISTDKTLLSNVKKKKKSNLHYTHGISPKRVTSGGAHLRGLAPGQRSYEETSQW